MTYWRLHYHLIWATRDRLPILSAPAHILWIGGGQIDERAKIGPDTRRVLCVRFRPIEETGAS